MKHPLMFMLLAGAALFGVQQLRAPDGESDRVVVVQPGEHADEALMLAEAYRLGWHESDPVVIGHLVQTMGFARPDITDPVRLMDLAHSTGLSRSDHMVQARLKQRMEDTLKGGVPDPSDEALQAWRQAHGEDYRQHDTIAFTQWIVPHGAPRPAELSGPAPGPNAQRMPAGLRSEEAGGLPRLMSLYGEAFVEALPRDPSQGWVGPIASAHGDHWLQVTAFTTGEVPPLPQIRSKVAADWRRAEQQVLYDRRLAELRAQWHVVSADALVQREEAP